MKQGLLYHDDDKKHSLADKVTLAAAYYFRVCGVEPDTCHVHPSVLESGVERNVGRIRLTASRMVMLNHFWIGVENAK